MNLQIIERNSQRFAAGPAGQPLMARADEVVDVVGACLSEGIDRLLLYAENLPPGFVDLSTGVAGTVLQKLQTYGIRTAFVLDLAQTPPSRFFADLVTEANRGREFRYFAERAAAEAWLVGDGG